MSLTFDSDVHCVPYLEDADDLLVWFGCFSTYFNTENL